MPVRIEVDVQMQGLPGWNMVGLLETAVKEAKERVGTAIRNAGFEIPNRKTTVNLSPADLKKSGAHYDLGIAIALLTAFGACRPSGQYLVAGELSLTGRVLPVSGVLLMALAAKRMKLDGIIIPRENRFEARLAGIESIAAVSTLAEAIEILNSSEFPPFDEEDCKHTAILSSRVIPPDFSEVRGQKFAKRGIEIAAAGGHNIALKGPPGTGKTMLAERLPTILPPLDETEAIDVLKIMSWHGLLLGRSELPRTRPFRAPHHSTSYAGLIGGSVGAIPRLGEISLAHAGVLFLDEMGEFRRDVLEMLRQPMESGQIRIVRAGVSLSYPANFMLVAAFNPCPCGFFGHRTRTCTCSIAQIRRYRSKLSGPLMDRIDIHIEVPPPPHEALLERGNEESSKAILVRTIAARRIQEARYRGAFKCNAALTGRAIMEHCKLERESSTFLRDAAEKQHLSARALHRVIKVARTIADLGGSNTIDTIHLAEALQFRPRVEEI